MFNILWTLHAALRRKLSLNYRCFVVSALERVSRFSRFKSIFKASRGLAGSCNLPWLRALEGSAAIHISFLRLLPELINRQGGLPLFAHLMYRGKPALRSPLLAHS